MSILSKKEKIFGQIAANRTLTNGMPQLKTNSSFPSVNNHGNVITFLSDLIKSLVGFEELIDTVETLLVKNINEIENEIKISLKHELKSIVSCGVNPSIPNYLKSTGTGIKIITPKVDFSNLMFVDPTSDSGKLLYTDTPQNLLDSKDFNAFLYQVIQNNGTQSSWGHQINKPDVLNVSFKNYDILKIDPNNTITIKANKSYDNKSLTDFNNDFIDSINLLTTQHLLTNIIDLSFGTISTSLNKSLSQLQQQEKINTVTSKIKNSNSNDVIDDSYFKFNNSELSKQQINATNRKNGIMPMTTTQNTNVSIPLDNVKTMNTNISNSTNQVELKNSLNSSINNIGGVIGNQAPSPTDSNTLKLNFIQSIIDNIITAVINIIISPKVIMIFLVNYKIVYGQNADFTDPIDFMKQNKNLIHGMIKAISVAIIKALLPLALKEIAKLVSKAVLKKTSDKNKLKVAQTLSLIGVPKSAIEPTNK